MSTISAGRIDFAVIAGLVRPDTKVLDVGCGDGDLLDLLQRERGIDGRGIEISQKGVNQCVARGLAVIQGDADSDLGFYQEGGFDYVILSQTLQATRNPRIVLEHLLRIGDRAIVSIPNFGHWRVRLSLFWNGRMDVLRGPERIDASWWAGQGARDYFIARHENGALCWVFREQRSAHWYLHGLFG